MFTALAFMWLTELFARRFTPKDLIERRRISAEAEGSE
jgi:hypothetical protein